MFDLFNCTNCSCSNKEDFNIDIIEETRHSDRHQKETPKIHSSKCKPNFEGTTVSRIDLSDLIIIEYPYERKKSPRPNLFMEKPNQPMQKLLADYTFKQAINTEQDLEDYDEFSNAFNEGSNGETQRAKKPLRTEESYLTTLTSKRKDRAPGNNSYSGSNAPQKLKALLVKETNTAQLIESDRLHNKHFKADHPYSKYPNRIISNYNNKPVQIKRQSEEYCKYCEEVYLKCLNDQSTPQSNAKCSHCNSEISADKMLQWKNRLSQIDSKPKTTRNNAKGNVISANDLLCKAKTVTKLKSTKNQTKPEKLIGETKSVNNSFTDERRLFNKKYSFLQLHNYSSKMIKKEKKKQVSRDLTSREYMKNSSRHYSYRMRKKHQLSLTISFGDENSQNLFEKKMSLVK